MHFQIINFQPIKMGHLEDCSICLEPLKKKVIGHKVENNNIYHCFHKKCLKEWIKTNFESPKCPLCNRVIVISPKTSLGNKVSSEIQSTIHSTPHYLTAGVRNLGASVAIFGNLAYPPFFSAN